MATLWPIFLFSLAMAGLYEANSRVRIGAGGERIYLRRDMFFFLILALAMSIFVGLRIWCNDTGTYREGYIYLTRATGPILEGIDWKIAGSNGFEIVNRVLKHLGFSSQSFLMFYAVVTNVLYLWFLRKYSTHFWLSVFFLWTMGVYLFTAAAIKQCAAIALGLVGVDRGLRRKWVSFVLWILLAASFHPYAVMFLALPWMTFSPWTNKTWYSMGLFAVGGFGMQRLVGVILDVTTMMGREYDADAFSGEGVNVFRLLVVWAPVVLSFFAKEQMKASNDRANNLFMNFSMLNAEIMFVALFGTANYFARLANYFLIFQTLALPWMLRFFTAKTRKILTAVIVICYMAYFIYTHTVYLPFYRYFAKMTLGEYLQSLNV